MVQRQSGTLRLVRVNEPAWCGGLRSGMTLAEAKALRPGLIMLDEDLDGDRRALESLALWAQRFAPLVHLEDAETLFLDISGCQRLFGGDKNILDQTVAGVRQQGFSVRAAIADTPGAAWALAHGHAEAAVMAEPQRTAAAIAPLPVHTMRIDGQTAALLSSVGVETIEALLHLPRSALAARFAPQLLRRLDQALGDAPEPLVPFEPQKAISVRMQFAPTKRHEVLQEAIRQTLRVFCDKLARQVRGVRQLFLTFDCELRIADCELSTQSTSSSPAVSGNPQFTIELSLSRASRSVAYWEKLLLARLETVQLPAPVRALSLWARHVELLDDEQDELFDTDRQDTRQLAELIDRLTVRLGPQAVARPELVSDHQPEWAYRYCRFLIGVHPPRRDFRLVRELHNQSAIGNRQSTIILRPLRLLDPPHLIAASALIPEGPPVQFRDRNGHHVVVSWEGPERIETGWWRGPHVQRDYYRVTDQAGRRFWIFRQREDGRWCLHGWFD